MPVEHHASRVALEARAEHDVGVAVEDRLDEDRVFGRFVFQVCILDQDDVADGKLDSLAKRGALAHVDRLAYVAKLGPFRCDALDDVPRAVA